MMRPLDFLACPDQSCRCWRLFNLNFERLSKMIPYRRWLSMRAWYAWTSCDCEMRFFSSLMTWDRQLSELASQVLPFLDNQPYWFSLYDTLRVWIIDIQWFQNLNFICPPWITSGHVNVSASVSRCSLNFCGHLHLAHQCYLVLM